VAADRRPLKGSPRQASEAQGRGEKAQGRGSRQASAQRQPGAGELSAFEAAEASEVEAAAGASLDEVNDQVVFDALGFNDARTGSQAAKAPQYLSVMA
jgi:hypothetical protein